MAEGVSGVVSFTNGQVTLRIYYAQTYTPGIGQSVVSIPKITVQSTAVYGITFYFDGKISVNGTEIFAATIGNSMGGVYLDGTEEPFYNSNFPSVTVAHTAAKDIAFSIAGYTYANPLIWNHKYGGHGIVASSVNVTLQAIPMASLIKVSAGRLGDSLAINLTKMIDGAVDTIGWQCGEESGTIAADSSEVSFSWTPPISLASQSPNADTVAVTITTATTLDGVDTGTNSAIVQCTIPSDIIPTGSIAVSDSKSYAATYGGYIQNQSRARIVVTAEGVYGSSIKSVQIACGSSLGYGSDLTFDLPTSGKVSITASITDSRNRIATVTSAITVLSYTAPTISVAGVYRSDDAGTEDADGAYATAEIDATVTSLSSKNTIEYNLLYRVHGTTEWTRILLGDVAGIYTLSNYVSTFAAAVENIFEVAVEATDAFTTTQSIYKTLPAAYKLLDFDRANKAIGIGRIASKANTISMAQPIDMYENRISNLGTPTENADAATKAYVDARIGGTAANFEVDETLNYSNGILSVNTAKNAEQDNTLPITSAAVYTQIGNIEVLLGTI